MELASSLRVPLVDLGKSHEPMAQDLLADIERLITSGAFTNGPEVALFEQAFARYCGTREAVGVSSGYAALRLGLAATGVEPGMEVIVPALTFVATAEAVSDLGARPVVVDVLADGTMDPEAAVAAMSARTAAVVPVHLYGQMADMAGIASALRSRGLVLIEDACQAHGAARDGLRAGSVGAAAAFSFYPTKNLGAFGDAGALTTSDPDIAGRVRARREHGQRTKNVHLMVGETARLDTLQAAVLLRKLTLLDEWNADRVAIASRYSEELAGVGDLELPVVASASSPVWHLYVVTTPARDRLASFLGERGIGTGCHYPTPVHLTPAYASLNMPAGSCPVAERTAGRCLSLPIYPGMSERQLERVTDTVREFFRYGG
jgi:dTDP-4-amino-4,6-dideoxygalactose transaminase